MRNALAYVPKTQQSMVAAALRQAFLQPDRAQVSVMLRHVADQLRPKWPKLAAFIDDSETEVLSYLDFPEQHRSKPHSVNPLERLNKEVKQRADVVAVFPNEAAIVRLIGAALLEQNDEWQLQRRYMQVEAMAELSAAAGAADPRQTHASRGPLQAIHSPVEGMDAKRSAAVALSSPAAAQRGAEGAGLDSGAVAAAQSAMPSIAAPGAPTANHIHRRRRIHCPELQSESPPT